MPLTMLPVGEEAIINNYRTKDKTKKFLESLGLVPGAIISVISERNGNLIVSIKGSRIALNKSIAQQLSVENL
jgi:ferrous iron transport protein A